MGLLDLLTGGAQQPSAPQPAQDPYSQFDTLFDQASKETGIPVAILKAQTMQESSFDPNVVSKTGGVGLMQIQPSTAQQPGYGIDPLDPSKLTDPAENIRFGSRYLAGRAREAGVTNWNDPQQAAKGLTAYNGGGDPNYAQNVFRYLRQPTMGAEAPATGPVDMYGNPLRPRGPAAQAAPQEPAASPQPSSQPPAQPMAQPTNEWAANLTRVATGGAAARADSFSGMNAGFGQSLSKLFQSAPPEIQKQLQITSAFRSPETQQRLWDQALAKYGSAEAARKWVAPPGGSKHGEGVAVDFKFLSPEAKAWVHQNATQFGIHFPLAHEPWHAEPIGSRGLNPSLTAAAQRGRGPAAEARKDVDKLLGSAAPGVKAVDARFAELSRQSDGLQRGSQIFDSGKTAIRPAELADEFGRAALPQGEMVGPSAVPLRMRQGARAEIDRLVGTEANDLNALRKAIKGEGDWNYTKLIQTFGSKEAAKVWNAVDREAAYREAYQNIVQGSQTAMRTGAAEGTKVRGQGGTASAGMPALAGVIGGPKAALLAAGAQGVKAGANQVMKAADLARNRQVASGLMMQGGPELDAMIDGLAQRIMSQSQTQMTAAQARELAQIMVMSQGDNAGEGVRRVGGLAGLGGMPVR